uniref:G_PROTEIN_RECEP_F1_2 domain-containing protein n=1 Tax=Ascaris lumbricoides TaxID=6252 RepID=A0A0M3HMH9_ASCLU
MESVITVTEFGIYDCAQMKECECHSISSPGDDVVFNFYAIVLFLPIMSTIGITTNLCSMYIYSRLPKQSTNRYLTALSISDFGVCVTGLLVICADSFRSYNHTVDQIWVFLLPKFIPFGMFFQMLSVYITVIAALDCFISVSRYFSSVKLWYCTIQNATKLIWITVVITAAYNLIVFGELETVHCMQTELNVTLYELCPTEMRLNEDYINIYRGYMYAAVMAFVPFVLLVLLTAGILVAISRKRCVPQAMAEQSVRVNSGGDLLSP